MQLPNETVQFELKIETIDLSFETQIASDSEVFSFGCDNVYEVVKDVETYDGDYIVTPMITSQSLDTTGKLMTKDVVIKEIPFFETSNNEGGHTIYIGKEL